MAVANKTDKVPYLKDGNVSGFFGGVDGNRPPADIDRDQSAYARNCTMRGGRIRPRPPYYKRPLAWESDIAATFKTARFQGAAFYDGNGVASLISSHGGRLFLTNLATWTVQEITPTASYTTTSTANVTLPAAGSTVAVPLASSARFNLKYPIVTLGAYTLTLISVDSALQITVKNTIPAQAGVLVNSPAAVGFTGLDPNNPDNPLSWMLQAENYFITQDNRAYPIIFDGSGSRRADQSRNEIPIGNVMCYAAGRLLVALPDRTSYRAGDIFGGASGTPALDYKDAILRFTENTYLNEGGDLVARVFGAPSESGPIVSMKAVAQGDTALGQGPVLIGTHNLVFTVNLPFDRTTWKNLASALQTVVPIIGPTGQNTCLLVNTDMWYRGTDGIRSYVQAQRQFNGAYGNTPMSAELGGLLDYDTPQLLEHGSAVLFDNRLLMTLSPATSPSGVYHRGLAVLDFNLSSSLRRKLPAAWEGVWTDLRILQILTARVNGAQRCFIFALNDNSEIELWELLRSQDGRADNGTTPISWDFETPAYNCGDSDSFTKLETGRFILSHLNGTLNFSVKHRTDDSPCWQPWASGTRCALNQDCANPGPCAGPHTYREQPRMPVKLPMPPDDIDPVARRRYRTGFEHQLRFEMSGYAEVRQVRVYCLPESELLSPDEPDQT